MQSPMQTSTAPASFQYFTLAVAIVAAMLSAGSLAVSFLAYRAGGPKIRVRTFRLSSPGADKVELVARVTNSGRGPVDIETFALWARFPGPINVRSHEMVKGEPLPYRLEGKSTRKWHIDN
jgi:hypothetical protein